MFRLAETVNAWGTPRFEDVLKAEVEGLACEQLPLQQGLSTGSFVLDGERKVMIIGVSEDGSLIRARLGIFYRAILAGCSCADDPMPVNEENEYCEVQLDIDRETAEATVLLLAD
jgi:hypothetical protein